MKERGILFSGPMVRAILEGRKTMTRRVVKPQPVDIHGSAFMKTIKCPYGKPGDRIWVRETFRREDLGEKVWYRADWNEKDAKELFIDQSGGWKPSIFMPRWASRITLEITNVRVERLQGISQDDAKVEGADGIDWGHGRDYGGPPDYIGGFKRLWESINGPGSWTANPWVWVVEFRRVEE
jgi:hypothetical protein